MKKDLYEDIFGNDSDIEEEEILQPTGDVYALFSNTTNGDRQKDTGTIEINDTEKLSNVELESSY